MLQYSLADGVELRTSSDPGVMDLVTDAGIDADVVFDPRQEGTTIVVRRHLSQKPEEPVSKHIHLCRVKSRVCTKSQCGEEQVSEHGGNKDNRTAAATTSNVCLVCSFSTEIARFVDISLCEMEKKFYRRSVCLFDFVTKYLCILYS